jgi:hypothetical protein
MVSQPRQDFNAQEWMTSILQMQDTTSLPFENFDDEMRAYPIFLKILTLL